MTTIRSTTGTAPIEIQHHAADLVTIALEDGSEQVYRRQDLMAALQMGAGTDPAAAWNSGYWHGTSHAGALNDAAVNSKNPYLKTDVGGCICEPRNRFNDDTGEWEEDAGCTGQC